MSINAIEINAQKNAKMRIRISDAARIQSAACQGLEFLPNKPCKNFRPWEEDNRFSYRK